MSGRPSSEADAPNPVRYTASNPAASTNRADNASYAPAATSGSGRASNSRNRAVGRTGPCNRSMTGMLARRGAHRSSSAFSTTSVSAGWMYHTSRAISSTV